MVKPTKGVVVDCVDCRTRRARGLRHRIDRHEFLGQHGTGIAGCKGTITVATDLPLTGGDVTDGPYVQMAAELAVTQAHAGKSAWVVAP